MAALAAVVLSVAVLASCSRTEPEEIPVPEGVDLEAAGEVGPSGNGLWILDGVSAAGRVIDAMHAAGGGTMSGTVHEMVPVEQGDPVPGRTISVESASDGQNLHASLVVGDQSGELIIDGQHVWVRGNAAFAERIGIAAATDTATADAFVCMARGPAAITELSTLAEPTGFLRSALSGLEIGALSPTEDQPEWQKLVLGTSGAPIGELVVAAVGAPLPQQLYVSDESGTIEAQFTWEDVPEIHAPESDVSGCE